MPAFPILLVLSSSLALFVTHSVFAGCASNATVIVDTALGKIRGLKKSVANGNVYAFTGIPFAEPPVGELRYRKPKPRRTWNGSIFDATTLPPSCMQVSVFQPRALPWVPYGLHDQVLALKWIQQHIQYFGGDPHEVTLFGWSAGGTSIVFHMASPESRDLLKRAIIQSADVYNGELQNQTVVFNSSRDFALQLGCRDKSGKPSSSTSVSCMRQLNATWISVVEETFVNAGKGTFKPIYGDSLLPVNPLKVRLPGDKDIIIGHVANEGTRIMYSSFRDTFSQFLPPRPITKPEMIHYLGVLYSSLKLPQIITLIETYMNGIMPYEYAKLRQALADIVGDTYVNCASLDTARMMANGTATHEDDKGVYFYVLDHVSACSDMQPWFGTTHGDDIPFVFGRPLDPNGCATDVPFSKNLMKIWTDFAKRR
ncbi:hypothetical protein HPB50_000777 [Hyalomma asiaticum]|uniref:Uncharacterized protein n=1 Tax=Hyalomma asiaticum TaxID=266040 RepID=A0ACB7RLL6_HYAAI|nr:hypothetical protein HPB50_000777 [Hyalomma asiaticum]